MDKAFLCDYYRTTGIAYQVSPRMLINMLFRHNIRFMYWCRKRSKTGSILSKYKCWRYSRKYGLEVSPNAVIGKGLYLGHPYNITIGDGVVLGDNVNIHKGATVGWQNRGPRMGVPTIGSQVYIGINATIIGKITIGDDVLIGPGALVNFDVPAHSVVLGNPGVIHHKDQATELYIRNLV